MSGGSGVFESRRRGWLWLSRFGFRPAWQEALEKSALPENATERISDVLTKAKLTNSERLSVARELVAHFEDGHADGCSYEQLLANFGETNLVANLIQRAKLRNRSMLSSFLKMFAAMIAFCVVTLAVMWGVIKMRKPSPSVNYLAQLAQPVVDADESEKAWPLYRGPWIETRFCDRSGLLTHVEIDKQQIPFADVYPGDPGWDQVTECLDDHFELLEAFRAGSSLPRLGLELQFRQEDYAPLDQQALFPKYHDLVVSGEIQPQPQDPDDPLANTGLIGVLLPHIQCFRSATPMFIADTRLAISEGETDRAIANIEASFGLGRQVTDFPFFVSSFVAFNLFDGGVQQIEELLSVDSDVLSNEQLLHLQNVVGAIDMNSWVSVDGERAAFQDIVQQLFTDDGNGNGKLTFQGISFMSGWANERGFWKDIKRLAQYTTYDRKEIVEATTAFVDEMKMQMHKRPFEVPIDVDPITETGNALIDNLLFDPHPIRGAFQKRLAKREATELALAIERYRRSAGKLPESLDELVPDFIAQIPNDPITGDDIRYLHDQKDVEKETGESFRIYSVALDEADDGGQPVLTPKGGGRFETEFHFSYDGRKHSGDWLLWPPSRNNP